MMYMVLPDGQPVSRLSTLLPNVISPEGLNDDELTSLGIARVVINRPTLEYWQTYGESEVDTTVRPITITYPVVDRGLDEVRILAKRRIEEHRDSLIEPGLQHTFPDGLTGTVQLGQQHIQNLLTVAVTALSAVVLNLDIDISFRDGEDVQHALTPIQGAIFALQASSYGSNVYMASWTAKDAIDAAQTVQDVIDVQWGE